MQIYLARLAAAKVRLEKLGRLRKSIAANTHHISAEDLAPKIIDHTLRRTVSSDNTTRPSAAPGGPWNGTAAGTLAVLSRLLLPSNKPFWLGL
jgi:hypothetical protein